MMGYVDIISMFVEKSDSVLMFLSIKLFIDTYIRERGKFYSMIKKLSDVNFGYKYYLKKIT